MFVLIAGKSPADRQTLKDLLVAKGYHVVEAATGMQAVARYLQFEPALVLLDYHLPDVNGVEVGRALLRVNNKANLVLYGDLDPHMLLRAYQVGFRDCLVKPVKGSRLLRTLQELFPRRPAAGKKPGSQRSYVPMVWKS